MENKTAEKTLLEDIIPSIDLCNRLITRFTRNDYDITDVMLRAYQAGHTAASSGMVKKEDVVRLVNDIINHYKAQVTVFNRMYLDDRIDSLTELLTRLNQL